MAYEWYIMQSSNLSGFEEGNFNADKSGFDELLNSFIGTDIEIYGTKISNMPRTIKAIVQNETTDNYNNAYARQILFPLGSIQCGEYIRFDDRWWLVVSLPDNNRVYEKAIVWYCKYQLNIQSKLNSDILTYPVFVENATKYGTGEEYHNYMTVGSSQQIVYIPFDEDTIVVDNDYRLLMDRNISKPTAYMVTQVDTTNFAYGDIGLIRWVILETSRIETDDVENMVADNTNFFNGTVVAEPNEPLEDLNEGWWR